MRGPRPGLALALVVVANTLARAPGVATHPARPAGRRTEIHIANFAFVPADTVAAVGDTIVWMNDDDFEHVVAADSGEWKSPTLSRGARFSVVVRRAGALPYHCTAHSVMRGLLRVHE